MESFSMLPIRTSSGRVIKEKQYKELLDKGLRPEDAMNIVLGKSRRRWSDRMTYMSPSIYMGPSTRNEGIMKQLKEPGVRHPKIKNRVIYLTGDHKKSQNMIKNDIEVKVNDPIEILKNKDTFGIIKDKINVYFDLDTINEELDQIDFVPAKKE